MHYVILKLLGNDTECFETDNYYIYVGNDFVKWYADALLRLKDYLLVNKTFSFEINERELYVVDSVAEFDQEIEASRITEQEFHAISTNVGLMFGEPSRIFLSFPFVDE